MAVRRAKRSEATSRLRAQFVARIWRTAKKVEQGKVAIEDVEADIRAEVDARVKAKGRP